MRKLECHRVPDPLHRVRRRAMPMTGVLLLAMTGLHPAWADEPCAAEIGRMVSVQGHVEVIRSTSLAPAPLALDGRICAGDTIRVGRYGRAALLLRDNESVLRLDQGTVLTLRPSGAANGPTLQQPSGGMHIITRTAKPFTVETPFINANIDGTEFIVTVAPSEARIAVYEGRVRAEQNGRETAVVQGDEVVAGVGRVVHSDLRLRPKDAVAWTLHVPSLLEALQTSVESASIALYRQGRIDEALTALARPGDLRNDDPQAAATLAWRAGLLLQIGRIDEARPALERALGLSPRLGAAKGLLAVIALAENSRDEAQRLASEAVEGDASSVVAWLALSYVQQAAFDLSAALTSARRASELAPQSGLPLARVAELTLSQGEVKRSIAIAEQAVQRSPTLSRPHTVLGFASLAAPDRIAATASFRRAIELDSSDPLPRLGLGLATIRGGDLAGGRAEFEVAASLDPFNSLTRSYLGKAYFQEGRNRLAATQFDLARERDPLDPTPYYYDAILKEAENRPIDALQDLEQSVALNDNRAVVRSRLLLDADSASRNAGQVKLYADLGFDQLAVAEAVKSVAADDANPVAHDFLADYYATLPQNSLARDSEQLQATLLRPLNGHPVGPQLSIYGRTLLDDAVLSRSGADEYDRLLDAEGLHLQASGYLGSRGNRNGSVVLSSLGEKVAYSLGYFTVNSNSFRAENAGRLSSANAFVQVSPSAATSLQLELRGQRTDVNYSTSTFFDVKDGDPGVPDATTVRSLRLGLRQELSPRSTLLANVIDGHVQDDVQLTKPIASVDSSDDSDLVEVRHLYRGDGFTSTQGWSLATAHSTQDVQIVHLAAKNTASSLRHANAYAYQTFRLTPTLETLIGASYDQYRDTDTDHSQLNPKFGLLWTPSASTTVRFAALRAMKRRIIFGLTIEPSGVYGFNQYFSGIEDVNGLSNDIAGIGVTTKLTSSISLAANARWRRLTYSLPQLGTTDPAYFRELPIDAHLYWTPTKTLAFSAGIETRSTDAQQIAAASIVPRRATTSTLPLEVRYFGASGVTAQLKATATHERGDFYDRTSKTYRHGTDNGLFVDAAIGYRFGGGRTVVSFEVHNLLDDQSNLQEVSSQEFLIAHRRLAFVKASVAY